MDPSGQGDEKLCKSVAITTVKCVIMGVYRQLLRCDYLNSLELIMAVEAILDIRILSQEYHDDNRKVTSTHMNESICRKRVTPSTKGM